MSPTQEVIVGILDASQSSCTLVSLLTSPQTTQIESAKKELAMKDSGETIVEPGETWPVETGTNNSVDLPLNAPEVNRSPDTNTSTSLPIKDDQCKLDQSNLVEQNSMDKFGSPQGLDKNTDVETVTKAVETVETIVMEKADSDNSKPSAATDNPEVNGSKTVNDIKASAPPTNIPGPASLEAPKTLQWPHNKPLPEQCETVLETKRPQTSVKTKSCTVRLEILTEADIVKQVHVHREMTVPAITPSSVVTPTDIYFKRSRAKPKPGRSTRHPRKANQHIDYSHLETAEGDSQSPTPKCQRLSRPGREPSSSWLKSDSFTTKQPIVKPLHRSSRLTTSPVTPKQPSATGSSSINPQPKPKSSTPNTSTNAATKGTFQTQSYGLKKSKKTAACTRTVIKNSKIAL